MKKSICLLILIISLCIIAGCSAQQDVQQFPVQADGKITVEQAILLNLEGAKSSSVELRDFSWRGLDELGYWEVKEGGQACLTFDRIYHQEERPDLFTEDALWIPITSILPATEQVEPLLRALDGCLQNFQKMSTQSTTVLEGRQPQKQLDAILKTTLYLAENLNITRKSQYVEIKASFNLASEKTRGLYLENFNQQYSSYLEILSIVLSCLQQAQRDLYTLTPEQQVPPRQQEP